MPPHVHAATEIPVYEVFTKIMGIVGAQIMMGGHQPLAVTGPPWGTYLSRCAEGWRRPAVLRAEARAT